MKVSVKNMLTLVGRGQITLQVPEMRIDMDGGDWVVKETVTDADGSDPDIEEMPEDWFMYLDGHTPVTGRKRGFLHFSKKGYETNKERIRRTFEAAWRMRDDITWADFEKYAEQFFTDVKGSLEKRKKHLKKSLEQLEAYEGRL